MDMTIQTHNGSINTVPDERGSLEAADLAYSPPVYDFPSSLNEAERINLLKHFDGATLEYVEKKSISENPKVIAYSADYYAQQQKARLACLAKYEAKLNRAKLELSLEGSSSRAGYLLDWERYQETKEECQLVIKEPNPWYSEVVEYGQDVIVKTRCADHYRHKLQQKRGKIRVLSRASRKRFKLHLRNIREGSLNLFVTLTYGADYPTDGQIVKKHLKYMRDWLKRKGVKMGVWFLEFQKRGAPHFHFFVESASYINSSVVAKAWAKIVSAYIKDDLALEKFLAVHTGNVKNGRPCVELVKKPHALSYYGTKYATKSHQKEVPEDYQNVGRFWGYWGDAKPMVKVSVYRGLNPAMTLRALLISWRCRWRIETAGFLAEEDLKERNSGTMWGGGSVFGEMMLEHEFVPF